MQRINPLEAIEKNSEFLIANLYSSDSRVDFSKKCGWARRKPIVVMKSMNG